MFICLERAAQGDPLAAARVIESLRPRLEKMAGYYGRRCGEDRDDLLQEGWLGVLESLPDLDTTIGNPQHYLILRARWRMLDFTRRQRIRRCLALDDSESGQLARPFVSGVLESDFRKHLKPGQRRVLDCLVSGLTWREAGAALGCSSPNIAYHVREIRRCYHEWSDE